MKHPRHPSKRLELGQSPGIAAALGSAFLFGASTPLSKSLLASIDPWLLAGLLYLGSGIALAIYRFSRRSPERVQLAAAEWPWLAGAIVCGGIAAPVMLMSGLVGMSASAASLLLNAEGVFTALLAWFVFRENVDRRIDLENRKSLRSQWNPRVADLQTHGYTLVTCVDLSFCCAYS